jgi:4'-phosphopantetheinyl transferase
MGQLSISHSHGHAFCAFLKDENVVLGADIELIEPRKPVFVADYFTDVERERVAAVSAECQPTLVTAIWSAKEAALKALHKGLSVDTRSVSCLIEPIETVSAEWQPFDIDIDRSRLPEAPDLTGIWCVFGRFVLTIATNATPPFAVDEIMYGHNATCPQ